MERSYQVIRSSRRTLALEVRHDGTVLVRAPRRLSDQAIRDFVASKEGWLQEKLRKHQDRPALPPLTGEELTALKKQAEAYFACRVRHFAPLAGVSYGRVTIRAQKTRWGSCSGKGNLNFNCLLMLAPPEVRDYVVVHELCHRREMNHSPRFWALVERLCPQYRQHRRWLKENGGGLLSRLPDSA